MRLIYHRRTVGFLFVLVIALFGFLFLRDRLVEAILTYQRVGIEEEGDVARKRSDWFFQQRAFPFDSIPEDGYQKASAYAREQLRPPLAERTAEDVWLPFGPTGITPAGIGRASAIAISPADPKTIYIGGALGGIWKTTDGGTSWSPRTDGQASLAISVIVIDPTNANIIYAGTGSKWYGAPWGAGILKSTDGGQNFVQLGATTFQGVSITGLVINPTNTQVIYAGVSSIGHSGAYDEAPISSVNGVYKSTDGGATWTRLANAPIGYVSELRMHPTNPEEVYAAYDQFHSDQRPTGIFKTTNGGSTWARLSGAGFPQTGVGRISFALARSSPSTIYASLESTADGGLLNIYKSINGGDSWSAVGRPPGAPFDPGVICFCGALNVLTVSPTDPNTLYFGGRALFRSRNGGQSWEDGVSGDLHAVEFDPGDTNRAVFGGDDGVFENVGLSTSYTRRNGNLSITQFYSIALRPGDDDYVLGGAQDVGALVRTSSNVWTGSHGSDGGIVLLDPASPSTLYHSDHNVSFFRSDNGGQGAQGSGWARKESGLGKDDRSMFIAPVAMDASNPQTIYLGTYRLYKTTNRGDLWTPISSDLTRGTNYIPGVASHAISAIAVGPGSSSLIFVGTSDGNLQISRDAGTTFVNSNAGLPIRYISRIVIDPANAQIAYLAISGFGSGHVFKTTNGGTNWIDISGNLPDVPANVLALARGTNKLYVGTDIGVFVTTGPATTWTEVGPDTLPNSPVFDLKINDRSGSVFAATHGRGVFKLRGPDCTLSFQPSSQSFPATGGEGSFSTNSVCGATQVSVNNSWTHIVTNDTKTIRYVIEANYSSQPRTATITAEGQTYTIQQSGANTSCIVSPSGLVAWWRFEGTAADETGLNGGTATDTGAFSAGIIGGAFVGDGTATTIGVARKIDVPDSQSLALTRSMSIEGWLRLNGTGPYWLLTRGEKGYQPNVQQAYTLAVSGGGLNFTIWPSASASTSFGVGTPSPLPLGDFVHFAVTLDDSTGQLKLYQNGLVVAQGTTALRPYGDFGAPSKGVTIGAIYGGCVGCDFNGALDELSVYNRSLTAAEVQTIYNARSSGKCPRGVEPTPSLVTVSGKVVTPDGRGLRNATVSMTDAQNVVRTTTTSSFGFFSFANVATGGQYVFRVQSRSYRYSPVTVTINDNLTLPDFVGLE